MCVRHCVCPGQASTACACDIVYALARGMHARATLCMHVRHCVCVCVQYCAMVTVIGMGCSAVQSLTEFVMLVPY